MNNKFFKDIMNIRAAIDTSKLVVFAGAGISIDAGIPGWNVLIEEMKSEINIPKNEHDYLRIAQMYFNDRRQKEFVDKVRSVLKYKKIKYNEIHEEIFQLKPEHILTTNFDDLLEQVIKKRSLPFSVVTKDKEFPYALNTNLLVKVHGDLGGTDIVLKEDDFIDYSLNHPLIEAFLRSVFASKVVLFVGYGLGDINLKMIIQNVRNILGQDFQNAYMLSVDEIHPTQREYLKSKGINVVSYFDAINNDGKNYITDYLKGNNALKENYYRTGENLSVKGQHLLDFLRFISCYDKFNEPLTERNIIDQIHLSLSRFSEFKSLPPDFVANLFPFNTSKQYVHNYKRYSLLTQNHQLYDLFFDQIEYVDDEVKFKPTPEMNLSLEQIKDFENKLKEIILTLNSSLIFYLFKENSRPDSFGNYGWSKNYKKLQNKNTEKCHCLNCRLFRLELRPIILEILNSTIDETTNIQLDLELAYANYKVGNFSQSFRLFDEIANKAWQAGKYFSYYIAKHNARTLRNLVDFFAHHLKEEDKRNIFNAIDDIDLDKLLFQIPFMGKQEYRLLKSIRDDDVLINAEKEIDNIYQKILDAYDSCKDGRSSIMGPYYPQAIEIELYKIISFYSNNYIVADEFSNFTKVCKKGIEALIISFATNDSYGEKLKEFNKLFFDVVVFHGDSEEIKAMTRKYEVSNIVFNEKDLPEILESVNNFLKSFFEETTFLGKWTFPDKETRNQIGNDFFESRCRKIFNNIFLLLSGVELRKENTTDLIAYLRGFIMHETFLHSTEMDNLCSFIYKNHELFSKEDLEGLLKSVLYKLEIYNHGGNLLRTISFVFRKNRYMGISDRDLVFKILALNDQTNQEHNITIVYLWTISDESIKEEIKNTIIEALERKFNSDLYNLASCENIIDYNKYFEQYIDEINRKKGSGDYSLNAGRPKMHSFVFINAMLFIYRMGIRGDDSRLKVLTDLTEYMQFYLSPESFNYDKFKTEWLLIANYDIFYERFKNISALKERIEISLRGKFDKELAEIYLKYFI